MGLLTAYVIIFNETFREENQTQLKKFKWPGEISDF